MKTRPNILWITIDAARKDHFSCYGYEKETTPFIDALAKKSTVFENAYTVSPWTLPSVSSMFTGLYPSEHGAINEHNKLKKYTITIAEKLKKKGYYTLMITQNDGWINSFFRLNKGFDTFYDLDRIVKSMVGISIRTIGKYIIGYDRLINHVFKKEILNIEKPWFTYIHLMDTHLPYEPKTNPLTAFFRYIVFYKNWKQKIWNSWIGEKTFSEREKNKLIELYDKTLINADTLIKQLCLPILKQKNTIIIITSDHGENLGEFGLYDHQFSEHDTLLRIPLIIFNPFIKVKKITTLFENKDLFKLLEKVSDGDFNSYKREYVYGENTQPESLFSKLIQEKNNLVKESKYIVTSKVKYIKYSDGSEILKRKDKKITQKEITKELATLCKMKQKQMKKLRNIKTDRKW